ncbi:MAG: hypothetical protein LWX56_03080 [Ignavibacteria bacterium]|nr:hypothetical protein [Ignavibacteria bacterium]
MLDEKLLKILCCPETKAKLVKDGEYLVSIHPEKRRRYRIIDDIPVMLIEESELLEETEWRAIMEKQGVKK